MPARSSFRGVPVITLLTLTMALPAAAQERLFARVPSTLVELDTSVERFGHVVRAWPLPSGRPIGPPVTMVGGRYLAWLAIHAATPETDQSRLDLQAFNTVTGSMSSVVIGWGLAGARIVGVNAAGDELAIMANGPQAGYRVTVGNVRTLEMRTFTLPEFASCYQDAALAGESRQVLALLCATPPAGSFRRVRSSSTSSTSRPVRSRNARSTCPSAWHSGSRPTPPARGSGWR